jgi:arylsulfatase A-like enzyme
MTSLKWVDDFPGAIARQQEDSTPYWKPPQRAPSDAPNIVIVYMDDMGFSDFGCFGAEIRTPNIDAVAERGVRFTHYTTHPICSPARAALLTGRNAHSVGSGWLANNHNGFPGYTSDIPLDAPTIAETLRASGYETIVVGKWHNTPAIDAVPSGSKHNWPTQRGFDTFYGFLSGETSFFFPADLRLNNQLVDIDEYPKGYYATDDWTDKAIEYVTNLRNSSPEKPFFLYVANNAPHAPLQAKASDLLRQRGRYDLGWTEIRGARLRRQKALGIVPDDATLAPSDPRVTRWDKTDPADRPVFARHMEAYAAMIESVDQNVGRLVAFLEELGELENTIIVISSDNGSTEAGGPHGTFNNLRRVSGLGARSREHERATVDQLGSPFSAALYPAAWGEVCNTPFPSFKTYTAGGGRRVPLIVSWPKGIADRGAIKHQFMHVTDIMPTLLDLATVPSLRTVNGCAATPMDGLSFGPLLKGEHAEEIRREQYYECWANRAFYRDGWLARSLQRKGEPIDMDNWTLHNLRVDLTESIDVSRQHPVLLEELKAAFDKAAWVNMVYPLDNRDRPARFVDNPPHVLAEARGARRYLPGGQTVAMTEIAPRINDRSFEVRVRLTLADRDEGVLWAIGDINGGVVAYVEHGEIHVHYNGMGDPTSMAPTPLAPGDLEIVFDYEALGNRKGRGRMLIPGTRTVTDWTDLSPTLGYGFFEGLDIGIDRRGPVSPQLYSAHGAFPFTGKIRDLTIVNK